MSTEVVQITLIVNTGLTPIQPVEPSVRESAPVVAPVGTVTVIVKSSTIVKLVAGVPLKLIALTLVNPDPFNVITSPIQAESAGRKVNTSGVGLTVTIR